MATVDLKEAYLLIPMAECSQKYLRFHFEDDHSDIVTFEFKAMPYGLSVAPRTFTKIMREVMTHLRSQGHKSIFYLDDILCIGDDYDECSRNVTETVKLLTDLGFVINFKKSILEPQQSCRFLGFNFNSQDMTLSLPTDKRKKIAALVHKFSLRSSCTIRELSQMIGTLIAACPAVKYGWLYTRILERHKYLSLQRLHNYDRKINLPKVILEDLNWWKDQIPSSSCSMLVPDYSLIIYSDASRTGWEVLIEEKEFHINQLELLAAFLALKYFSQDERNCTILLRIDNTTAISYINRMGGVQFPHLNELARQIWQWCEKRNIWLFASYINTKDNVEADKESRRTNPDTEWELSSSAFFRITKELGQPNIDLFASRANAKCPRYISWRKDSDAIGIDAFTMNWSHDFFYAFPPFSVILKCLQKIIHDKATGILVFPEQTSTARAPYPGCRSAIQLAYDRRGLPTEAWELMLGSLAKSTIQQYNVSLKLWWSYCLQNNRDVFDCSVPLVISFLTEQYNKGASYGSINSHRSALSLFLGNRVGSDEHIKRLLKGVFKMRPNLPKYSYTWDPKTVLDHIAEWFPNTDISLEKITKKLASLLALCTAHRVQTLSLIKTNNISIDLNGITITITDIIKTSMPGREQPENPKICPATVLQDYISVTRKLRNENTDRLLITVKRPHKNATAQSISRWLKQVLAESGVNVALFSGHSTRHAATSAAAAAGVSIEVIRKTAGWTSGSQTFAKFYNRRVISENNFARQVCGLPDDSCQVDS
ncbi:hypothetical protein MSG28_002397 [Choristoneura fumiferana]|uniref:Uncharacterized protein n=1 Tax=Choristoneura fumiferana TaxID=7141 RepID=A0ACC0JVD9_CHOFU|nr:hypothetical protein MSG28_002397 [Choristoneura fumiferana]